MTANAYLGCWGIVEALDARRRHRHHRSRHRRRRRVRPGGVAPRLARDDWDALAGAVVAGHLIECSGQATGGNYSFFTEVPGIDRLGFPWAEVAARRLLRDRQARRHRRAGVGRHRHVPAALRDRRPALLRPRRHRRFDTITLEQVGADRVRVFGVHGEPPPPTLKVAMNAHRRVSQPRRGRAHRARHRRQGGGRSKPRSGGHARSSRATTQRSRHV